MRYLVTATMEFYQWVDANSEEEVQAHLDKKRGRWLQTINEPLRNFKIEVSEPETSVQEAECQEPESAPEYK